MIKFGKFASRWHSYLVQYRGEKEQDEDSVSCNNNNI